MIEIRNAVIRDTFLGREDHGIMTCYITLDYGGSGQSFGGYAIERRSNFITKLLDTLEVTHYEKLRGEIVRVKQDMDKVYAIGHPIKDKWFNPEEE